MKKLITLIALSASFASPAFARDVQTYICSHTVGQRLNGTLTEAIVYLDDNGAQMVQVLNCSGVLNWGCGNGMDNLINESYAVNGDADKGYLGAGVSLATLADGSIQLLSPALNHTFPAGSCSKLSH